MLTAPTWRARTTAIVDGEEIVVSSTVTGEWGELPRLTITVPRGAGSTLDEITLTFSDGAAAYNNGIGVRELKLSKISDAYDTNDPEWTGNGVTEIGCFPILDKTETYIEIRDRVHYLDMLKYVNEDITLEVGEYYTLTLWLRGIPDDTGDCGKLGMYVNYPISSRKLSSTWGATQYKGEYDLDVGAFVLKPEWEEHKVTFTALNEEFVLLFEGERTADHSRIVNIAGLSLTASDELGNPTGEELISDWTSEYSGGIGWTTAPYADNTGISYAIIDDYVYKTANADGGNNTVLTYDTDEAFEAGTYTVSGRVRLGNRQDSYVEYALTKLRHTLWLFLVHADDNSAELALTLGGETVDSVNITNEWSDIEFTFTVDSAGVPDLALALDGAFDLDFADLTVYAENN